MKYNYQKPEMFCYGVVVEHGFTLSAGSDEDSMTYENGGDAW